ncbi:hypothetical protein BDY24DRAFT_400358 [Mrakia frigida]|uniref:Gfo/Idh/MocA family protein n=1 Tax=Mrakia frigida TaxID=29902 RepID=UPI003FCBF91A
MPSSPPKTLRWGIIGTGAISKTFCLDLLIDPKTRGVNDLAHQITAVGSRTVEKATQFIEDNGLGKQAKWFGSYEEVYSSPDVDAVYIGSPTSQHYGNAKDALNAGKHVLCEKSLTVNAAQAEILASLAKEKKLFLMEAIWTRFFPSTIAIQEFIASGKIGDVERIFSDLSIDFDLPGLAPDATIINPNLAGGALLAVGPYSLLWCLLPVFPHPSPITLPTIAAQITLDSKAAIDIHTSAVLTFPPSVSEAHALLTSSLSNVSPPCEVLIQGSKGQLKFIGPTYRPEGYIFSFKEKGREEERMEFPIPTEGMGYFWEADEVARCIFAGKLESERMTLEDSITVMKICRDQEAGRANLPGGNREDLDSITFDGRRREG